MFLLEVWCETRLELGVGKCVLLLAGGIEPKP